MWLRNSLIIILVISVGFSQSILNSNGIGNITSNSDAASIGSSNLGLFSSFRENVSLSNPVTWHNLPFTYLAFDYTFINSIIQDPSVKNSLSRLGSFHFIVPMKKEYAFGLKLTPYLNRHYLLQGPETPYSDPVFDDTLNVQYSASGAGGVNSFEAAFSLPVTSKERIGISFDLLFGSSREVKTTHIDDIGYILKERNLFKGSLFHLYLLSERLKIGKYDFNSYASFSVTIDPISLEQHIYSPFEDATSGQSDYGNYDPWDFPSPSFILASKENNFTDIVEPMDMQLGFDVIDNYVHYQLGWYHWQDNNENASNFSLFKQQLKSSNHFNVSVCKFSQIKKNNVFDNFEYRFGLFLKKDNIISLTSSESSITQKGVSLGIGYQFGPMKNQLDIGYSLSLQDGLQIKNEFIHSFNIGISIGDLWFVKRRQR